MRARTASLVLVGVAAACGGSQERTVFRPGPLPEGAQWTGVYFAPGIWGRVELWETNGTITGHYEEESTLKTGCVTGSVAGNLVRFEWTERDDRIRGRPRIVSGRAVGRYVVAADGTHHVEGRWGLRASEDDGGAWRAERGRTRPRPPTEPCRVEPPQPDAEEGGVGAAPGGEAQGTDAPPAPAEAPATP